MHLKPNMQSSESSSILGGKKSSFLNKMESKRKIVTSDDKYKEYKFKNIDSLKKKIGIHKNNTSLEKN